jgi:hypothetical protein
MSAAEPAAEPGWASAFRRIGPFLFAATFGLFWTGSVLAYAFGYFGRAGLVHGGVLLIVPLIGAVFLPPLLGFAIAWTLTRGRESAAAVMMLQGAVEKLLAADENAATRGAHLAQGLRAELESLNRSIDMTVERMHNVEGLFAAQMASFDESGARIEERAHLAASRLAGEQRQLEALAENLVGAAERAGELVADCAAQLRANLETAKATLASVAQVLDQSAGAFRNAAATAADAPHSIALELDRQTERIESAASAALSRVEFVLARQEKSRASLSLLIEKMQEEGFTFENALGRHLSAFERAVATAGEQARTFETVFEEADARLAALLRKGSERNAEWLAETDREIARINDACGVAVTSLSEVVDALQDASARTQALIGDARLEARSQAQSIMGDATEECVRLLRTAAELARESRSIKETLTTAVEDMQNQLLSLPGMARQEAQRVRDLVRQETEEILDLSARTVSEAQVRGAGRSNGGPGAGPGGKDTLKGLTQRLAPKSKRKSAEDAKPWDMRTLLAAVDGVGETRRDAKPEIAASLTATQALLADAGIHPERLVGELSEGDDALNRYLTGDRAALARRLSFQIDDAVVGRVAALYRDNVRFRDSANAFLGEFETLLSRAREKGEVFSATMMSADSGCLYVALAYALGRMV